MLIRILGIGLANVALVVFDAVGSAPYGAQHWGETLFVLTFSWILYILIAVFILKTNLRTSLAILGTQWDCIRIFTLWFGISLGFFYIPASVLAAGGTLLMVFPLYGTFYSGLVLLAFDPPKKWIRPHTKSMLVKFLSSGVASLLFCALSSFYRDAQTNEIRIGDWSENLIFCIGAWLLYVVTAGVAYLLHNSSRRDKEALNK